MGTGVSESQLSEILASVKPHDYPADVLATMIWEFYRTLKDKEGMDEGWARKLTEIYLSGL